VIQLNQQLLILKELEMDKKSEGVIIGAAVGVVAGALAGILFAPQSGKETRKDIVKYLHEMKDKIAKELSKAGNVTKEKYNQIVKKVVAVYEKEKKITTKEAEEIKEKLAKNFHKVEKVAKK